MFLRNWSLFSISGFVKGERREFVYDRRVWVVNGGIPHRLREWAVSRIPQEMLKELEKDTFIGMADSRAEDTAMSEIEAGGSTGGGREGDGGIVEDPVESDERRLATATDSPSASTFEPATARRATVRFSPSTALAGTELRNVGEASGFFRRRRGFAFRRFDAETTSNKELRQFVVVIDICATRAMTPTSFVPFSLPPFTTLPIF